MAKKKFNTSNLVSEVGSAASNITGKFSPSPSVPTGDRIEKAVRDNIKILPELEFFIRKLGESEYNLLKEDISKNGCKESIKLWRREDDFVIVDGHHRYQICQELGIDFKTESLDFASIEDVKIFMAKLQLGRRNLTPQESSYLRGMQYGLSRKTAGGIQEDSGQGRTRTLLAQEYGVSEATIMRDYKLYRGLEKVGEAIKQDYLSGDSFLRKMHIEYIAVEELLDVQRFIYFIERGGSLEEYKAQSQHGTQQIQTAPNGSKSKPSYFEAFASKFDKELKVADTERKQEMKHMLQRMLEKIG
ncbi:ParB/RepB/Spo0J family partition protein [Limibacter armeniacum]|uniref:ParB/RepB/Spo0J family partition protein n=1 Tax=Limibacter armeniacum TaxID=466084 RepID=UPI002FE63567